ncbi:MAG: addiction module protein [Verrucomicrobiaceae bacterium]|nr:addiction module protein [Verrucomicrobiaceae bacterium]
MTAAADLSTLLLQLPPQDRAELAVNLIDSLSLGEPAWEDDQLAALADERDAELESGAVKPLSYDEFIAGLRRPSQP